jgi:hypothetical protein
MESVQANELTDGPRWARIVRHIPPPHNHETFRRLRATTVRLFAKAGYACVARRRAALCI